jgi:hypothetical protein
MKITGSIFAFIVFQLSVFYTVQAQVLPAKVTTTVQAPYSLYLSDYSAPGSTKLSANIIFNDFNEPSWNVRLRITIESDRIRLQTNPDYVPSRPITVTPGVMLSISGADLEPYLNANNIIVVGAKELFQQSGRLPEGMYKFCVEVLDYASGKLISHSSCATAWLNLLDAPRIISPSCGMYIKPSNPQNIVVQWHLTGLSPNLTQGVEYKLIVHELIDSQTDPRSAIHNGKTLPIFESDWVSTTQYLYDMAAPMLDLGKIYIYYTQVKDIGGRDLFKNNGISEICWFYYGYPENAKINLRSPQHNYHYTKLEVQSFSWSAPDLRVANQPFVYKVKIVKILPGQDSAIAMQNNVSWHEVEQPSTTSVYGYSIRLDKKLDPMDRYAWQVTAFSGEQKVATSEIFTFTGPPFMEYLKAGRHMVKVLSTNSLDPNDMSGTGRLGIGEGDSVEVRFDHVVVFDVGRYFRLKEGNLHYKFSPKKELKLNAIVPENNDAIFYIEKLRLTNDKGLQFYGAIHWALPHAVLSAEKAFIRSEAVWCNYDKFLLDDGKLHYSGLHKFDLLEPLGFQLTVHEDSYFLLDDGKYRMYNYGAILIPEKVKSVEQIRIAFPFHNQQQLFYIVEKEKVTRGIFQLVQNTGLQTSPTSYTIDLSSMQSPGWHAPNNSWKGVYVDKFKVHYLREMDKFKQLQLDQDLHENVELSSSNLYKNWIDQDGLDFSVNRSRIFSSTTFNTFPAQQKELRLIIENNSVTDSWIKGGIKIPVISETEEFEYTLSITERGFSTGYLDESLAGKQFVFNKEGGEQRINIFIQRAVFLNHERLCMTVDLEWPHTKAALKNVKGFSVWGDYNIGFNEPNGSVNVDKDVKASVNGYPITVSVVGGGRQSNYYSLGASGQMAMGGDISGPNGPTEVNLYSINTNGLLNPEISLGASAHGQVGAGGIKVSDYQLNLTAEQKLNAALNIDPNRLKVNGDLKFDLNGNLNSNMNFDISFNEEIGIDEFGTIPSFSLPALQNLLAQFAVHLPEERKADAQAVINYIPKLDTEIQMRAFAELCDMKKLAGKLLKVKLEALIAKLMAPIDIEVQKLEVRVNAEVDKVLAGINLRIDAMIGDVINGISLHVIKIASAQGFNISAGLNNIKVSMKNSISAEIKASLKASVQTNIVGKFTGMLNGKLLEGVRSHLAENLLDVGFEILDGKASTPKIDGLMSGIDKVFIELGESIIGSFNIGSLENSIMGLANGFIANISVGDILKKMLDDLLLKEGKRMVENYAKEHAQALFNELSGGGALGILADNVQLDFSNIKEKLMSGRIDKIIKFDPTNIKIETSIALIQGTVKFNNDDPEWGDSWGGELDAQVKIQPAFGAKARFMNGKKDGIDFWFFDVSVSNLRVAMVPTPFTLDGAEGRVYKHMELVGPKMFAVSHRVEYGANLQLNFYDTPMQGTIVKFDLGAKVEMRSEGFYIGMLGNAKVGNFKGFALATGTGEISYNSAEKHFLGKFEVHTNTKPLLCAGGAMGVDVNPDTWQVYIGKREDPITVNPLCGGIFKSDGWFLVNPDKIDLGMHIRQNLHIESPWINLAIIKVKPFAEAGFDFGAQALISLDPMGVEEAQVWIELWAGVGAYYDWPWPGGSGKWYLAQIDLGGRLGFQTIPKTRVWGSVYGRVTVVGIGVGFNLGVDHTF